MPDELIRQADKMGLPLDGMMELLIAQAPLDAAVLLSVFLLFLVPAVPLWLIKPRDVREPPILWGVRIGHAVMILTLIECEGRDLLMGFFNPRLWALSQVLQASGS